MVAVLLLVKGCALEVKVQTSGDTPHRYEWENRCAWKGNTELQEGASEVPHVSTLLAEPRCPEPATHGRTQSFGMIAQPTCCVY